ncbi:MAG: helix-turn-helix domain-containing protein [Planctomycetes bacterium]|nr:helix-turn-helix domain-containing protein [Planctomycetota bacterium]
MAARESTEKTWRKNPAFKALCRALAACNTPDEVADFLRDIGTLTELHAWSERLEVARLLAAGKTYREIAELTGASTTTVTRVARFLREGEGGYRCLLMESDASKVK